MSFRRRVEEKRSSRSVYEEDRKKKDDFFEAPKIGSHANTKTQETRNNTVTVTDVVVKEIVEVCV